MSTAKAPAAPSGRICEKSMIMIMCSTSPDQRHFIPYFDTFYKNLYKRCTKCVFTKYNYYPI